MIKIVRDPHAPRDDHALAEIDDDGNHDRYFRYYRYVCRCGEAGSWQKGVTLARGEHAVHLSRKVPNSQSRKTSLQPSGMQRLARSVVQEDVDEAADGEDVDDEAVDVTMAEVQR